MRPSKASSTALLCGAILFNALLASSASALTPGPKVTSSPNDPHAYRSLYLDNQLQVVLIHDPKATNAAITLNVMAGSALDPQDMPGLAHFLEHMMFLGCERFPDPDGFHRFINLNGGSVNASTGTSSTQYTLSLPQHALPDALERLGQMFSAPLFDERYVERERRAIDAEYQMRRNQDGRRLHEAIGLALNPTNPLAQFKIGNLQTLKDSQTPLRQRVMDFHRQHYSANLMRLAVSGPQSLDELQTWVASSFSNIPNHALPTPEIKAPLALEGQLPANLQIRTASKTQTLMLLFPVPRTPYADRRRPIDYVTRLLVHKGPGSLHQRLLEAGLAQAIEVAIAEEQPHQALLGLKIGLLPEGARQLDRVQATVMSYLQLIAREGLASWRYEAMQQQARQTFTLSWKGEPGSNTRWVADNMLRYPLEDALYGPFRLDVFSPEHIRSVLDSMSADHLLRVYLSDQVDTDQQSRWFSTPYHLQRLEHWPAAQPLADLALPLANRFVIHDLRVLDVQAQKPRQVMTPPGLDLWYHPDRSFASPSVITRIELQRPGENDLQHYVLRMLLVSWLNERMKSTFEEATQAGVQGKVMASSQGLQIQTTGLREHQLSLLSEVLQQLTRAPISESDFERLRNRLIKVYENNQLALLYERLDQSLRLSLQTDQWLDSEKIAAVRQLTIDDLQQFRQRWNRSIHVQGMVTGNLDETAVQDLVQRLLEHLDPVLPGVAAPAPLRQLAPGLSALRPSSNSQDSGILVYLPMPNTGPESAVDSLLLGQLLRPTLFRTLRTEQQLGYVVDAYAKSLQQDWALYFLAQSHQHPSQLLLEKTLGFIADAEPLISSLQDSQFETLRQGLLSNLQRQDTSLNALAGREWAELQAGFVNFDQRQQWIAAAHRRTRSDLLQTWRQLSQGPQLKVTFDPGQTANIEQFQRSANLLIAPGRDARSLE